MKIEDVLDFIETKDFSFQRFFRISYIFVKKLNFLFSIVFFKTKT